MKKCKKCKETKPNKDFSKAPGNKDGLQSHCKVCAYRSTKKYKNKIKTQKGGKFKGYDTYVNDDGVTCITNFNPYGLSRQSVSKEPSVIRERRIPMTFSSDLAL